MNEQLLQFSSYTVSIKVAGLLQKMAFPKVLMLTKKKKKSPENRIK